MFPEDQNWAPNFSLTLPQGKPLFSGQATSLFHASSHALNFILCLTQLSLMRNLAQCRMTCLYPPVISVVYIGSLAPQYWRYR